MRTVSAQLRSQRRDAQTLLPHRLTKPDALSRETGQHIEWIGKGDDLFGLRALALFHARDPLERAAAMSLKAIVKYLLFICLFLHASTSRKKRFAVAL